jgi:hypothetical protein
MTMGIAANEAGNDTLPIHRSPPSVPGGEPSLAEMVEWIGRQAPGSGTEALRQLRAAFPDSPLTLRVAALNLLIRHQGGDISYIPR